MLLNCGVGEDSWESLGLQESQPVYPKENQSWIFIGRTDAEAETPMLWPPDVKNWLIWKDPDAWKNWGQEETGTTEEEMVGWHLWLNGHGFICTLGVGDGQGGLVCCGLWGCKESDKTEPLNWNWKVTFPFTFSQKWKKCLGVNRPKGRWKTWTLKTIPHWWKKLKKTQTDGKIYHILELEQLILVKWPYYPKWFTDSMKSLSNYQWYFLKN